jgi:hypothetical protein
MAAAFSLLKGEAMNDWIADYRMLTVALALATGAGCGVKTTQVSDRCWMECQRINCEAVSEVKRMGPNGETFTCMCGCNE